VVLPVWVAVSDSIPVVLVGLLFGPVVVVPVVLFAGAVVLFAVPFTSVLSIWLYGATESPLLFSLQDDCARQKINDKRIKAGNEFKILFFIQIVLNYNLLIQTRCHSKRSQCEPITYALPQALQYVQQPVACGQVR
jgi:hypothetical protein